MLRQPAVLRGLSRSSLPTRLPTSTTAVPRRTFRKQTSGRAVENLNIRALSQRSRDYQRNRRMFLWSGVVAGVLSFGYTAYKLKQALENQKPIQLDSASSPEDHPSKVVVHDVHGHEVVATGNSTVPEFPRTLRLPAAITSPSTEAAAGSARGQHKDEYTLVGLGLRTVTFIGIQVYVVGYYVATADIAALQAALTKRVNPIATTLVPAERDALRADLLDPVVGERLWNELLAADIPARSAFRVVPVRDTDFPHLRDGFVRAIQARVPPPPSSAATAAEAQAEDRFGESMKEFRALFNRGSVPKRRELLLLRGAGGQLNVAFDEGKGNQKERLKVLGTVEDERVSRALWLNWLAGKNVASEPARKSIVEGLMEFVERPVGTVAAQVV